VISSSTYAEWTKTGSNTKATNHYTDFDRIKKRGDYVYFWQLRDYLNPTKYGILSSKIYNQGDCKLFRYKILSTVFHKQPMGRGWWRTSPQKKPKWKYPSPKSIEEVNLKSVCSR
jgi:hypothetical protein